ncbi:MAG: hypothetical protein ACXWGT_06980, partial [Usitatibacter sp.]
MATTLLAALMASHAFAQDIPGTSLERRAIRDSLGRKVVYYIGHPRKPTAPVMLMIQGSGCSAVINEQPTGSFSTLFNLVPFASEGEFTMIAVEKPFSEEKSQSDFAKG